MFKVLKPFPYSADGKTTRTLAKDEVVDISPDLVEGLTAAKLIAPTKAGKGEKKPAPPAKDYTARQVGEAWSVFDGETEVQNGLADEAVAQSWISGQAKA